MNAVVFALNGCPTAALGPYGNEWIGTPNLDRLAAESVVFDRHISDCPDPAAAHLTWRTPGAGRSDLIETIAAQGGRSILIRACRPEHDPPKEFLRGWSEVIDARPGLAGESPAEPLLHSLSTALESDDDRRLVWVEIDRLTPPWQVPQDVFDAYIDDVLDAEPGEPVRPWADPPSGWFDRDDLASWELLHRSLAATLTAFDAELGRVFDQLRERGWDRSAAWVFTAARGYPLGEHGLIGPHRLWLHEELVHLPLIVRLPDKVESGRRVFALTQPADLAQTLAEFVAPEPNREVGLFPLIHGQAEAIRPHAISITDEELAIRTPEWALLVPTRPDPDGETRQPMLFEKPADHWEVNDLHPRNSEVAQDLERTLLEAIR